MSTVDKKGRQRNKESLAKGAPERAPAKDISEALKLLSALSVLPVHLDSDALVDRWEAGVRRTRECVAGEEDELL